MNFEGRSVAYDFGDLDEIALAFVGSAAAGYVAEVHSVEVEIARGRQR